MLEESATGSQMTKWTVYSVKGLVLISQRQQQQEKSKLWPENGIEESMVAYLDFGQESSCPCKKLNPREKSAGQNEDSEACPFCVEICS